MILTQYWPMTHPLIDKTRPGGKLKTGQNPNWHTCVCTLFDKTLSYILEYTHHTLHWQTKTDDSEHVLQPHWSHKFTEAQLDWPHWLFALDTVIWTINFQSLL